MELIWTMGSVLLFIITSVASTHVSNTTIQSCDSISEGSMWEVPGNVGYSFRLRNASKFCVKPSQTFHLSSSSIFPNFKAMKGTGNETVESHLDGNGTFTFYPTNTASQQYPVESYCMSKKNSSWSEVQICCSETNPCFRKCCPVGESWDPYISECAPIPYNTKGHWRYRIKDNGDVEYIYNGQWVKKLDKEDYCVDRIKLLDTDLESVPCPLEQDILVICVSGKPEIPGQHMNQIVQIVYIFSILAAMFCLLATAVVLFRRKDQQNIHVWTILCYVMCQFIFYSFIVFIRLVLIGAINKSYISEKWCIIVGVVGHFFGISTFAWLSVINFDLWWTFRVLQPIDQKKLYSKRFGWYLIFSVFLPLVIVSISVVMHMSETTEECIATATENSVILPEYGKSLCFLSPKAQLYYFYIPIGILLLINFAFYIITSYKILRLYNRSQRINSQKHKQSCQLFLKLFLVMGTLWIFQVISVFIQAKSYEQKWYFVLLDMVNVFQALAVFIIFVCNRPSHQSCSGSHGWWMCFYCCIGYKPTLYRTPTLTDRSTDGSTRISRTDNVKSVIGPPEWPEPSEIIQLS